MQGLQQTSSQFWVLVVVSGIFVLIFSGHVYGPFRKEFSSSNTIRKTEIEEKHEPWLNNLKMLRDIEKDVKNFYLFMRSMMNETTYKTQKNTVDDGYIAISSLIETLTNLSESKKKIELDKMKTFTRQEIERRQNPVRCDKRPMLVIDIKEASACGFGCVLHTVGAALLQAFVANRTFVLKSKGWPYATEGWEYIFLPLGGCTSTSNTSRLPLLKNALSDNHSKRIMTTYLKDLNVLKPWSVPREFFSRLKKLHSDPFAWWIAQFTAYIFRFQPWFQDEVDKQAELMEFPKLVAGIQIRWGDKIKNAEQFPVEQYMEFVENWYKRLEYQGQNVERIVYLATEELEARNLIKKNFPQYKFIMLKPWTKEVHHQRERYHHEGLTSVAMDIHFLSRCNYLVCTLSSNVCRTAYELMLVKYGDVSTRFHSLDVPHHLKTCRSRSWKAIMDHEPSGPQELSLKTGDNIQTSLEHLENFNKGFARGRNTRTNQTGIFPVFKAREEVDAYNISIFYNTWRNV